jgi:serine/threonine protein kinase
MGEVYQARDTKLDRDVALKVLPEAFTSDPDRLARFEREAKVLASSLCRRPYPSRFWRPQRDLDACGSWKDGVFFARRRSVSSCVRLFRRPIRTDLLPRARTPSTVSAIRQLAEI